MHSSDKFNYVYEKLVSNESLSSDEIIDFINEVLKHIDSFKSPIWHSLGFINLDLFQAKTGNLRLHIWPSNLDSKEEQKWKAHDHKYDFVSQILLGNLTDASLQIKPLPKGELEIYEVVYEQEQSRLIKTYEYVEITRENRKTYKTGDIYFVSCDDFHYSIVNKNQTTVTLMATLVHDSNKTAKVIGESFANNEIIRPIVTIDFDKDIFVKYLKDVLTSYNK